MEEDGSPGSPGGVDRVGSPGAPWDGAPAGVDGIPPELDGIGAEGEPLWPDWDGVEGMPPGLDGDGNEGEPLELDELGEGMEGEPLEPGEGIEGELLGDCGPWEPLGGWGGVGNPLGLDEGVWGLWGCCGLCWVWVSQAASAATTSPPRANFASAAGLKFKACIILPSRAAPVGSALISPWLSLMRLFLVFSEKLHPWSFSLSQNKSAVLFCLRIQWLTPVTEHSSVPLRPRSKLRFENACLHPSNSAALPCAAGKL